MNHSMLFGYTRRDDGLYEKIVHFEQRKAPTEKLVRDKNGKLMWVENLLHRNRSVRTDGHAIGD